MTITLPPMSNLLKTLGDDWHADHVYRPLIDKVVPTSENKKAIELALIEIYVAEHYDFKTFRSSGSNTIYDDDIEICKAVKKETEDALKREEETFRKLLEKFQQLETPEPLKEEEGEEEEEEDLVEVNRKGKGQKMCKRSLKAEEQHKQMLAKGAKSSMASSQQKLMELNEYIQQLDKKAEYFTHYQKAARYYQRSMKATVESYASTKDVDALIKELDSLISYYEMMMRRNVPDDSCDGVVPGLCTTHLLPLHAVKYTSKGEPDVVKCKISP